MNESNDKARCHEDTLSAVSQGQNATAGHIAMTDASPPLLQKIPVRFPSLQRKVRPPSLYIHVDEALNHLGEKLCPTEWGIGAAWELHPFQYSSSEKGYATCWLEKTKNGFEFQLEKIESNLTRTDLKACNRVYRKVRDTLKKALEDSHIRAFKLIESNGRIDPIAEDQRGLWTVRFNSIFYTGHAYEHNNGESYKYRILIERRSLEDWLANLDRDDSAANKPPPKARLARLAAIAADHAKRHGYVPSKSQLLELLIDVLSQERFELSGRRFQKDFWDHFALPSAKRPGRPAEHSRRQFEQHKSGLAQEIRNECRSTPSSQTIE